MPSLSSPDQLRPDLALIAASSLFDAAWYRETNPDIAAAGIDPLMHFADWGWREGRRPDPYFDPAWYLQQNPEVARAGLNPLVHYIRAGEAANRLPCPHFDLLWFRSHFTPPAGTLALAFFLARRTTGTVSPLPEFDAAWYLREYPDIAAAGVDPFEHYLLWGWREGRNPSPTFDTRFYVARYFAADQDENPLLHYRRLRHVIRLHTVPPPEEEGVHEAVRRFTQPGPAFEEVRPLPSTSTRRARVLAYYLPQFHTIAENDAWWGPGFTEWTALARGVPRFAGHYQPRVPRDLGHYTLDDPEVLRRQVALARGAGLGGFVFYFYSFNGRRLLERPLETFLADRSIDFPFCLMWANENWTRRWDGSEDQVLIAQRWQPADEIPLVDDFARHFRDPRYIRLGGRPLLMVYRAGTIPDCAAVLSRWRRLFRERHDEDPVLVMAQSFEAEDPRPWGFDGAVEFPPHKLVNALAPCNAALRWFDFAAHAKVYDYSEVAAASLAEPSPAYPLIKTAVPGWDNDPRRQGQGLVLHGATPAAYEKWLAALVERSARTPFFGERLVCVNAWNEWAEGAYLEPDLHFGGAWLNATARAVAAPERRATLLLVGHDAFPAGAQHLLLQIGRSFARRCGVQVEFLLLEGGEMEAEYARVAPTRVLARHEELAAYCAEAAARGVVRALVNTAAAAWAVPVLREAGVESVLLIHELPRLLRERHLLEGAQQGAAAARRVIFPAPPVHDAFVSLTPLPPERTLIRPQGCYTPVSFDPAARARLRRTLKLGPRDRLVLGAGHADLRKGFDLFLQAWRACQQRTEERGGSRRGAVHFCWVGSLDPELRGWLAPEIAAAEATGTFRLAGWQQDVAPWFNAADVFVLTSREDPFPTVVLEALCSGLPVAAFEESGGIPDLLRRLSAGLAVTMGNAVALADALLRLLAPLATEPSRARRAVRAQERFAFEPYAQALLDELIPGLPRVSVAVLSCNYASYLERRLASVFAQTHPVAEVLLLDDGSADASLEVARRVAADWRRTLRIEARARPSGSAFRQWRRAAELARGTFLWIAEADDDADPELLATLAALARDVPDLDLAFCDSRSIDADGNPLAPSYHEYYRQSGAAALTRDGVYPSREFAARFLGERNLILNVSAVLWRRSTLLGALERCGTELDSFRLAGDWRLYLEALANSRGRVAVVSAALNVHRRHARSLTARVPMRRQLEEIARIHTLAAARLTPSPALVRRQARYRAELSEELPHLLAAD